MHFSLWRKLGNRNLMSVVLQKSNLIDCFKCSRIINQGLGKLFSTETIGSSRLLPILQLNSVQKSAIRCRSAEATPKPAPALSSAPPKRQKPTGKGKGPITWRSVGITFGIGGVFMLGMLYVKKKKEIELEKERKRAIGKAKIGGPFNLIDHNGQPRTNKDFLGKWVLMYFGFTNCPDICPDEIEKMVKTVDIMEKRNITQAQALFITVDPDRDDINAVKNYVKDFSPKLLGLTGTKEQINEASKNFRVYYSAGPKDKDADYIVDHTIIIYLMNPEGEFVDYYGQNKTAEEISDGVLLNIAKYKDSKSSWF